MPQHEGLPKASDLPCPLWATWSSLPCHRTLLNCHIYHWTLLTVLYQQNTLLLLYFEWSVSLHLLQYTTLKIPAKHNEVQRTFALIYKPRLRFLISSAVIAAPFTSKASAYKHLVLWSFRRISASCTARNWNRTPPGKQKYFILRLMPEKFGIYVHERGVKISWGSQPIQLPLACLLNIHYLCSDRAQGFQSYARAHSARCCTNTWVFSPRTSQSDR